ncbi:MULTISPECIES: lipase family protein [unclassified Streptomyces]|uniref:lipase family protein n=1 Tax=unclassified Streptomyces TaxID=2593676 RepID=UPI001BEAF012|nr:MULTISPECIES: lipase family protein [unclassified Streptomyces]MBT2406161.1 hypothetical protein [Streptomyces sp. ISL-21]MBT2459514.1 hypothetical protein [Streptomyces sp. ISL-86]MBT2609219.1 hypothetical protein [Streptomyces sp. ISL-87]
MEARVVYVHGNGNKVREELLKSQWDKALFGADMGGASRMAYWAATRYRAPLPDSRPDPLDGDDDGTGRFEESVLSDRKSPEEFVAQTLAEARLEAAAGDHESVPGAAAGDPAEAALSEWLREMTYLADALDEGADGEGEGEGGADPVPGTPSPLEALPLPRFARTPLFRMLVERTFKDVHAYFFGGAGPQIREMVKRALDGGPEGGPLVVVGHSLGTIAAYEVLREEQRDVDLFVTVGSPLAVTEVQDVLLKPPAVPAGVVAWCNASDARDLVALDHTMRPEFAPIHLVTDHLVVNDSFNHHGFRQYLASKPVSEAVRGVFGRLASEKAE